MTADAERRVLAALCGAFPGDGLAESFEQSLELRHALAQLADLLAGLLALGVDPFPQLLALGGCR